MTSCFLNKQWHDLLDVVSPDLGLYRPSWYESWLTAYENQGNWEGDMINFSSIIGGRLHAIFPACTQKFGPLNFISLAGNYFPMRSFPACKITPEIGEQLLKQFSERAFVAGVRMGPVSFSDANIMSLVAFFKQSGWSAVSRKIGKDFVLATDKSWKTYEANISRKRRQNLKYYWNKLLKTGEVSLRLETNLSCSGWAEVFSALADVESQAWVATKGECRFLGEQNQIFWKSLIQDEWFRRSIKVWRIMRDQKTISFALIFDAGTKRFVYANSYIEPVTEFSTGSKIYYHLIKDAFESEITEIHFGLGDSGYKSMWDAKPEDTLTDLILLPPTLIGKCAGLLASYNGFSPE